MAFTRQQVLARLRKCMDDGVPIIEAQSARSPDDCVKEMQAIADAAKGVNRDVIVRFKAVRFS